MEYFDGRVMIITPWGVRVKGPPCVTSIDIRYAIYFVYCLLHTKYMYHNMIIITMCNSSPVRMGVEPQMTKTFD